MTQRHRVGFRVVTVLVSAWVLAAGCDPAGTATNGPTAPLSRRERDARVRVENEAFGRSRRRVARAVADLKSVGLWDDLTNHLYVVNIQSRPGAANIPEDRHLADAFLTGQIDDAGSGGLCSIMFFPAAVRADYSGVLVYAARHPLYEPPSYQHFWSSILGHELAHCFTGQPGEKTARRWERTVLSALEN